MDSIKLKEEKREILDNIEAIDAIANDEKRSLNAEEKEKVDSLFKRAEELDADIKLAEKIEKQKAERAKEKVTPVSFETGNSEKREQEEITKKVEMGNIFRFLTGKERLEGAAKELHQEGENELRSMHKSSKGFTFPSWAVNPEQRATVDQANSAIAPTAVAAYVDALRENAVHTALGIRPLQLTGDYKIPIVGEQSLAWASAENSAAADGGAQFTSDTLTPFRLTGYVDVSQEILIQNGMGAFDAVMRDLGRETANKIDAAMFNTSSVSNAPPSLGAKSGILTFTEASYSANASVLSDLVEAEQTLAENEALSGATRYLCSPKLLGELKKSAQVASVTPAMNGTPGNQSVNGYPINFSVACTNATTTGDGYFGDFAGGVVMGYFGGMDMVVDPYSALLNDELRVVVHRHVDWGFPQAAKFVKFTSALA